MQIPRSPLLATQKVTYLAGIEQYKPNYLQTAIYTYAFREFGTVIPLHNTNNIITIQQFHSCDNTRSVRSVRLQYTICHS